MASSESSPDDTGQLMLEPTTPANASTSATSDDDMDKILAVLAPAEREKLEAGMMGRWAWEKLVRRAEVVLSESGSDEMRGELSVFHSVRPPKVDGHLERPPQQRLVLLC